jgi:hypothetical protein
VIWWSEFLATDAETRVQFSALPKFLGICGSGTGFTQPREYSYNSGATWKSPYRRYGEQKILLFLSETELRPSIPYPIAITTDSPPLSLSLSHNLLVSYFPPYIFHLLHLLVPRRSVESIKSGPSWNLQDRTVTNRRTDTFLCGLIRCHELKFLAAVYVNL